MSRNNNALFYDGGKSTGPPKDPRDIPAKWINYAVLAILHVTAVFLFYKALILDQYNLIIAGITFILVLFFFPAELITAKWFTSIKATRLLFAVALVFGFGTSALISRDLDPSLGIPPVYFGCFRIHHWWWASGRLGGLLHLLLGLRLPSNEQEKFYKKHANFELLAGFMLLSLFAFAFIERDLFPNTVSFRLVSGWVGAASLMLGLLLKTKAPQARGFKRVVAALLGITTGVWLEGLMLNLIPKFNETITFWECLK